MVAHLTEVLGGSSIGRSEEPMSGKMTSKEMLQLMFDRVTKKDLLQTPRLKHQQQDKQAVQKKEPV